MSISTRLGWIGNVANGKGFFRAAKASGAGSNTTAAAAAAGYISAQLAFQFVGTTLPATIQGFQLPPAPSSELLNALIYQLTAGVRAIWLARFYQLGTLDLTATGDKFTHSGTFTRIRRTVYGAANQNIPLLPFVHITTATTVTAPVFRLRTAAGGAGYVDQDGNSVVGAKTLTMPAAATAVNSCFFPRLEEGDFSVLDVTNIEVTTAGSAGAATIYGIEPIVSLQAAIGGFPCHSDSLYGGFGPFDVSPGTPDSGSVTSHLGLVSLGSSTGWGSGNAGFFHGALNA